MFWYLATPYTKYSKGHEAAFQDAAKVAALLSSRGMPVFCPIAHSHPLAETGLLPKTDHDLWMKLDTPFMEAACGLIVCKMDGWMESAGVQHEIKFFQQAKKPTIYMDYPEELKDERY